MPPRRQPSASRDPVKAAPFPEKLADDALGLKPRMAAVTLLEAALARRSGLDEATSASAFLAMPVRERAFARALTMATLRHLGPIDRRLHAHLEKPPPEAVLMLLRIGVAQCLYLQTADFAAVSTTVQIAAERPATRPFKGLVNAVLRAVLRDAAPSPVVPKDYAPAWLYARWRAAYGEDAAAIAARIAEEPPTDLTLKNSAEANDMAQALDAVVLSGGTLRTPRRGDVVEWPGFAEGLWWVQDAAASIPARLLPLKPGETALDLCAAPGGKTLQLAATGAFVTALDRSATRLKRLSENLARMGLSAEVVAADAARWPDPRQFNAVLLDAPCSATGTFRRHPDVLWAAKPGDIAKLAAVQTDLLASAAARVAPGGRLVYCVCSLEPEEGEAQAVTFLTRHADFALDPIGPEEGGAPAAALSREGWLRLTPGLMEPVGGMDGFFVARFRRAA
jgi:16S rRNA (cytosine967-C5)-methyltransferase